MSSSLDLPLTGKSIPIALAFALRACVRACDAKLRERDDSSVARGGQMQVPGQPAVHPAVRAAVPLKRCFFSKPLKTQVFSSFSSQTYLKPMK